MERLGAKSGAPGQASWAAVFGDREYRGMWLAYVASLAGDQLARVALAVLVFDRTESPLATAGAYAIGLLPWLIGGPLLTGLGDRYPRRTVMVTCDAACAVLVAMMILPGMSLWGMAGLLFAVVLLAAPFTSARASLVRDVFPDERYALATAVTSISMQAAHMIGFAVGGFLVAAVGARQALAVDAVTFALSALLVRLTVRARPAPQGNRPIRPIASLTGGVRLIFNNPTLRRLTLLAWLAAFHVVPAGIVVPYADDHGGGPITIGLLLAAIALGTALGAATVGRVLPPEQRLRLMGPLAIAASVPLVLCAADPGVVLTGVLWLLTGAATAYQLAANVAFVSVVPDKHRAQAFGLVATGLIAGQGIAVVLAGALASVVAPHLVVAGAGAAGLVCATALVAGPGQRFSLEPAAAE